MVIHHIEDRTGTLRQLGASLRPGGLLTVVEFGDRPRYLPDDLPIGPPGLQDRLGAANDRWLASMGFDLTSEQLVDDAAGAGLELVAERVFSMRLEAPLPADARRVVRAQLDRARSVYADELDDADLAALDTLCDDDGAEGALQRADLFLATSRHAYAFAGRS
jgi:hypothetical protein